MLKKLIELINKPLGYIDIPWRESKGLDYGLSQEFNNFVRQKQIENYKTIIGKLYNFIRDEAVSNGYIKTDRQCLQEAQRIYLEAKSNDLLDTLNKLKSEAV